MNSIGSDESSFILDSEAPLHSSSIIIHNAEEILNMQSMQNMPKKQKKTNNM